MVRNLQLEDGKMIPASQYFSGGETSVLELTAEEVKVAETIKVNILCPFYSSYLGKLRHFCNWYHQSCGDGTLFPLFLISYDRKSTPKYMQI